MMEQESRFSRSEGLLTKEGILRLASSRVAVFGLGGVGGYAAEILVRSGVGALDLIDGDNFSVSNLNRQLHATVHTIGEPKTEAVSRRMKEINPECKIKTHFLFFSGPTEEINFSHFDYVIDAIDSVTGKVAIIREAVLRGIPVISAMGAGNKLDPSKLEISDLAFTSVCPLARIMRRELKKVGIEHVKVVYSKEPPLPSPLEGEGGRKVPQSVAFVPAAAGILMGGEVVKDIAFCRLPKRS